MLDVPHALSIAFSGADLSRALWIGLIASLLCSRRFLPLKMAVLAFMVDRSWPYLTMALSGYSMDQIAPYLAYRIKMLPEDGIILGIRAAGLFGLIATGYVLRVQLHKALSHSPKSGANAY
ncbi:hypothetical protein PB2503_08924 [Parvularcula bermudensis HTCC2503]|uniref:Uncharacterized protein n=1 Tax=Parvularcula bermudensis (strain ATCC BAA-594 / HTCC2503 / KCTC 12087) TaxID=314260 RepID=E0TCE8_PARBH|nr:hypothetical protein [Parvularcula bermudensis]ADM09838.1 hypothetical protein PB2503_08924 [Parvularcula bermudensis HTCC2503]